VAVDFSLSDEQVLLRDSVQRYVGEHCTLDRHRALAGSETGFDPDAWAAFAELGWLAVPFAAEHGGFDGGAVDLMVVTEALGAGHVREPYLVTVVTCGGLLAQAGSEDQCTRYLPAIIDGSAQWALAFAERGSDFDLANLACEATLEGSRYRLSGDKIAVLNGHCADHLLVTARCAAGASLFVVDAVAPGLSREAFVAVDGSRGAHISLDGVVVDEAAVLGTPGGAVGLLETVFDTAIVAMGAEALGAMQALLEATVEYTRTREQFGQPISRFQALQHRMADMYLKVEETRSLLLNAAIQVENDSAERGAACAALKVKLAEAGRFVSQQAVQLHGGIGMTDELAVSHYFKRLLLLATLYGDESYYLRRYINAAA
jgi:alkylation response protein AidB-like acyl-CoA dehydrogenase